ncbi:MAG TPA: 1,2-phenylacetyl-CoA epoxidase subunit PaaC [Chitinophagaceae bacterium]|nr:1,2-phenylacetyl-CoA epoxidase subunit PaaC [Chitinophagaceae bacterium]
MSKQDLIDYVLHLADNNLILGQRNAEWCGHGPVLEQDIAITNITLDLVGQARNFYQYASQLKADGSTEDSLAYLRTEREYKNHLLLELPNGDWGQTILKQFLFSQYQYLLYHQLKDSADEVLAAIAIKSLKEITYHLRWSSEWVIRLGDGTKESHQRMLNAIDELWSYTGEFFEPVSYELEAENAKLNVDVLKLKEPWLNKVKEVFAEATLPMPDKTFMHTGGKNGVHTEHLGYILTELQYMQRAYPGCEW